MLVWHVTLWAIWKARNDWIFLDSKLSVLEIVDHI